MSERILDSRVVQGTFLATVLETAEEEGVNTANALSALGLSWDDILRPEAFFTNRERLALIDEIEKQESIPGFGFKVGLREGALTHGPVGWAIIASHNLRQGIRTSERYHQLMEDDLKVSLRAHNNIATFNAQIFYKEKRHRRFAAEEWLGNWCFIGRQLRGGRLRCSRVNLSYASPSHAYLYNEHLRCPVHFDEEKDQMIFEESHLDTPFITANPSMYRIAISQCESLYVRQAKFGEFTDQVRHILLSQPENPIKLVDVARRLNMSERNVRRRLELEQATFQGLQLDVRMSLATNYLKHTSLPPSEISHLVGYLEQASFYRNFKRWSGMTPGVYRQSHQETRTVRMAPLEDSNPSLSEESVGDVSCPMPETTPKEVIKSGFGGSVKAQVGQALLRYWADVSREGKIPVKDDVDLLNAPKILPYLFFLDFEPKLGRMRCIWTGHAIVTLFGFDPTGLFVDDLFNQDDISLTYKLDYEPVASQLRAVHRFETLDYVGKPNVLTECVLLPVVGAADYARRYILGSIEEVPADLYEAYAS